MAKMLIFSSHDYLMTADNVSNHVRAFRNKPRKDHDKIVSRTGFKSVNILPDPMSPIGQTGIKLPFDRFRAAIVNFFEIGGELNVFVPVPSNPLFKIVLKAGVSVETGKCEEAGVKKNYTTVKVSVGGRVSFSKSMSLLELRGKSPIVRADIACPCPEDTKGFRMEDHMTWKLAVRVGPVWGACASKVKISRDAKWTFYRPKCEGGVQFGRGGIDLLRDGSNKRKPMTWKGSKGFRVTFTISGSFSRTIVR